MRAPGMPPPSPPPWLPSRRTIPADLGTAAADLIVHSVKEI
jgi:hypothetical protein